MNWADLDATLAASGLVIMGALHEDGVTVAIVGTDSGAWAHFQNSTEYMQPGKDPLDTWSKRVLRYVGRKFGAVDVVFPSDGPPFPPFIRWSLSTGRFWQSPIGMMVHDRQGLMISLRGAFHFSGELDLPLQHADSPCATCSEQPCKAVCPVGALAENAYYNVDTCKSFLRSDQGSDCMSGGCLARRACPVSQQFARPAEQSAFHMRAFLKG